MSLRNVRKEDTPFTSDNNKNNNNNNNINNDLVIHRQVKTNDIISRRFGDFMTPFSRVK